MSVRLRVAVVLSMITVGFGVAAGQAGATTVPEKSTVDRCERGEFCVWIEENFYGSVQRVSLVEANPGECVPLPDGVDARSFANRADRPVTVYQGRDCSTEGDFSTYPGGGTYVPQAPFVVRGVQIWEV